MADRLPPMQALRAFEAAARAGSLTRAAESLNLTHGAISHQIKSLEAEFGIRLIERAGRGIRLTDEGERFAARVRAALADLADAVQEVTDRANPRQLRVSVLPSFAARWLLPRIGRFFAANPDIDLDVSASNATADFHRDNVDVAIRHGFGEWPGVAAEFVMEESYFPVCSPRLAGGQLPERPADLSRFTLLRSDGESWELWFQAAGLDWPEPSRGPMFNDTSHTLQAAIEGQGIALARTSLIGNDLHNGVLVRLFDISVPSPRKYFLVYPPRLAEAPKLVAFRRWLLGEVAAMQRDARTRGQRASSSGRKPVGKARNVRRRRASD
ncbi:MAG TPA: transcriptional regulator GcvA [Casimicrobiaceae bacterium]|nr:transcriptional regulator GcvA [Casimicrobiaceae bacterium]